MSKIGKINIAIPEKVKVTVDGNNLKMEGPMGKNNLALDTQIFNFDIKDGKEISISLKEFKSRNKKNLGLNRSLINNAIRGINEGSQKH